MVRAALGMLVLIAGLAAAGLPARAAETGASGAPPFNNSADPEMWRSIRQGVQGKSTLPDPRAGILIQAEGETWRELRNGPVSTYGTWGMAGVFGALALFYLVRGRIRLDAPRTGRTVQRFNGIERGAHWLTASSFIVLALSGLNLLYGRYALLPLIGPDAFAALAGWGKLAHNYLGFAFMAGVLAIFLMWVRHNIPERGDIDWIAKAGGLFSKNVHPKAKKFNAGQKVIFWSTVLGGAVLSATGLALLFPFTVGGMQDMQLFQVIHAGTALVTAIIIIGHIYIGSVGMEGAFAAMGSGQVEEEWAREHHSLWLAEVLNEGEKGKHAAPAE